MKVIIAGSRTISDINELYAAVREAGFEITEVVCGEARGVDLMGRWWASQKKIPVVSFPAEWNKDGRVAGYRRNQRMADYADALIAVWDGESVGTAHMIGVAHAAGLKIYIHRTLKEKLKVFVFGSNLKGIHGAGAAASAVKEYGAEWGVGEGRTGNAYAIPTKATPYKGRTLAEIRLSVNVFLGYAQAHPELEFLVTKVGTGLAGFTDEEMAPMFANAPSNCRFDPAWEKFGLWPWERKQ
jgi:hypothetical protein